MRAVLATAAVGIIAGASGALGAPAGWSPPEDLSGSFEATTQEGASLNHPKVGVSGNGDVVAVWQQDDQSFTLSHHSEVWMRDRPLGGAWGPAGLLGSGTEPQVAASGGTTAIAWMSGSDVVARVRHDGAAFSAPQNFGRGSEVRVGVDDSGVATVLWSGGGVDYGIRSARYLPGSGWSSTKTISFSPTAQTPDLAVSGNGDAIAAWKAQDGVRVTEFSPQAGWTPHHLVAPGGVRPSIAANDAGQVVLAWTGPANTVPATESIQALTGSIRGGLANQEELSDPVLWDWWSDQPIAEAALGRGGDAVVAWNRLVSAVSHTGTVEVANTHLPGGGWGPARAISVPTFVPMPSVGVAPDGAALTVWRGGSASLRTADQAGFSPSAWTEPFVLTNPGADAYNPDVAVDDAGRMHVVWADLSRPRLRFEDHLLVAAIQATSFGLARGTPGDATSPTPSSPPAAVAFQPAPRAGGGAQATIPVTLPVPKLSTVIRRGTLYLKVNAALSRSLAGRTLIVQRRVGKRLLPLVRLRVPRNGRISALIALNTNSNRGPTGVRDSQTIRVRIAVARSKKAAAISSALRTVPV